MRRAAVPASLKNVCEGDKIGLHIVVGVVDAVPDLLPGREVNDAVEAVSAKQVSTSAVSARFARMNL